MGSKDCFRSLGPKQILSLPESFFLTATRELTHAVGSVTFEIGFCCSILSSSIFRLSLKDMGTLCEGWTTGGVFGLMNA